MLTLHITWHDMSRQQFVKMVKAPKINNHATLQYTLLHSSLVFVTLVALTGHKLLVHPSYSTSLWQQTLGWKSNHLTGRRAQTVTDRPVQLELTFFLIKKPEAPSSFCRGFKHRTITTNTSTHVGYCQRYCHSLVHNITVDWSKCNAVRWEDHHIIWPSYDISSNRNSS